jgi:hypothetical protein
MSKPEMIPIQSSFIESIGYLPVEKELQIRFKNGSLYAFYEVPEHTFENLRDAESKGRFFKMSIERRFQKEKLGP